MAKKIEEGLKNKGLRNAKWDKMEKQKNESDKFAPFHDQGKGKKVQSNHKVVGKDD